jgi:hypothetical protein
VGWAAKDDRRGPLNEARRTEGRNEMEDCAHANPVEHSDPWELAQLRRAAAGLEGSAAHPANRGTKFETPPRLRGARAQAKGLQFPNPKIKWCGQLKRELREAH